MRQNHAFGEGMQTHRSHERAAADMVSVTLPGLLEYVDGRGVIRHDDVFMTPAVPRCAARRVPVVGCSGIERTVGELERDDVVLRACQQTLAIRRGDHIVRGSCDGTQVGTRLVAVDMGAKRADERHGFLPG